MKKDEMEKLIGDLRRELADQREQIPEKFIPVDR